MVVGGDGSGKRWRMSHLCDVVMFQPQLLDLATCGLCVVI